jgi:hypothetical protein
MRHRVASMATAAASTAAHTTFEGLTFDNRLLRALPLDKEIKNFVRDPVSWMCSRWMHLR